MALLARIAPRDGRAAILDSNGSIDRVFDVNGNALPSTSSSAVGMHEFESAIVDVEDARDAVRILKQKSDMSMCLDMVLMLFDDDISLPTRSKLAVELQALLAETAVKQYTQDILFTKPLPATADVKGAAAAVDDIEATSEFIQELIDAQPQIHRMFDAWLMMDKEKLLDPSEADRVFAFLSFNGVFRRLAFEVRTQVDLASIKGALILSAGQNRWQRIDPRDLQVYFSELEKQLPQGIDKQSASRRQSQLRPSSERGSDGRESRPVHATDHASYEAALIQIDTISDLYADGKDDQANSFLDQMIRELGKHASGQSQIVKSLCNIATKVSSRGRRDISFQCHEKALNYPSGIDAKLYLQLGQGLSGRRCYDEAVKCFEQARALDDGRLTDEIYTAEIRARMEIGQYREAITQLRELPYLSSSESDMALLGKALRRTGQLQQARIVYNNILEISNESHLAHSGLAEVQKQSGRPHQAIAKYNAIVRGLEKIEGPTSGALRVYNLARSHLFRMTKQFDDSEEILRKLLDLSNADQESHLQLAKLLQLKGDRLGAERHFSKARGESLSGLAQLVFAKASKFLNPTDVRQRITSIQSEVMPEDIGTLQCLDAYDMITNRAFEGVENVFSGTLFVDKPVSDLAKVLQFHAQKRMLASTTMKSDHVLCRIAKRSDTALRKAVLAIEAGNLLEALELEADAFLRLVA